MSQAPEFNQALLEVKYWLKRYRRRITVVVVGLIVVIGANSMFYSVAAHEEGVVLRFGKYAATTPPGLHFKLPWPVDQATTVPVQEVKSLEFGFATIAAGRVTSYRSPTQEDKLTAEMLSGDLNLAHVEWIVQYRIGDPFRYLFRVSGGRGVHHDEAVQDVIRDAAESVMRRLVGDVSVDEVLTFGRDQIAVAAKRELQATLDRFDTGITVVTVKLQSVSPPDPVKDAFDSVNRARQNKEQIVNQAREARNRKIPETRGRRDQTILEAEGYRERVVRAATGQANAFLAQLAEYEKAPEITRTRLYLEAMEELLQSVGGKLVIDEAVRGMVPLLDLNADTGRGGPTAAEGGRR